MAGGRLFMNFPIEENARGGHVHETNRVGKEKAGQRGHRQQQQQDRAIPACSSFSSSASSSLGPASIKYLSSFFSLTLFPLRMFHQRYFRRSLFMFMYSPLLVHPTCSRLRARSDLLRNFCLPRRCALGGRYIYREIRNCASSLFAERISSCN